MRPKYIFSSRKTRRARESPKLRKQKEKYPSLTEKIIRQADIILEVLDARFSKETRNPEIEKEIRHQKKKLILVLNKSDLLQSAPNNKLAISCKKRQNIKKLRDLIKQESRKIKKEGKILVGVIGYPNTGKSSLINVLTGRSSAGTGADAGFTKGVQKLRLDENITLLDTPGVIPKKEYSSVQKEKIAQHTIVGGRSYSQVKDPEMVIANLIKKYPETIKKHYKTKSKANAEKILDELGKRWNYLKKGNKVNDDKTARRILKDWQSGAIKI